VGVPLTAEETHWIVDTYSAAVDSLTPWAYWDYWSSSVQDGSYEMRPPSGDARVDVEEMGWVLLYCFSPFVNPTGAPLVDCDIVKDPTRWGEQPEE